MFTCRALLILSLSLTLQAQPADEPDLAKEARLYNIYKEFNESPTPESTWQNVLQASKAQSYLIQKGDTLWDISNTFFADSQFWPKIWSLNSSDIFNPHEISPKNEVLFVPGSLLEPPQVAVQAKSEKTEPSEEEPVTEDTSKPKDELSYELPAPIKRVMPITPFPDSLPSWNYNKEKTSKQIMEIGERKREFPNPDVDMLYYVADAMPESEGYVIETEMDMRTAAEFQYVHVKMNGEITVPRDLLAIFRTGKIEDKYNKRTGNLVEIQGMVQVLELINPKENIYRAMVRRSIQQVSVGAQLITGDIPTINANPAGESSPFPARIIGGQFSNIRRMYSRDTLVFLNAGQAQGLSVGQMLPIYKDPVLRVPKTRAVTAPLKIGDMKVVRTSDNFATAVVLSTLEEVRTGDSASPDVSDTKR